MEGIEHVWSSLGGAPAALSGTSVVLRPGALRARLPVREAARACVGACALAAAELAGLRAGLARPPAVRIDDGAVATAFTSERHLRVDGREPVNFAPLSRWWQTGDGRLRTHANYPHHRERLLAALGVPGDVDAVGAALARWSAAEAEEAVYAAGGLAVASRTPREWATSVQGAAVRSRPLVERGRLGRAPAREFTPLGGPVLLPAAGIRVLDLTRVVAGPVATRTLALLGADVLRLDPPALPELPDQHADTGFGKRSATLDLASGRAAFDELLAGADVVVTGYRPDALDRFGLSPRALAERRPGLVVAQLSAWGAHGPWARRRGFDSLVQAASGIAVAESSEYGEGAEGGGRRPGVLPAQALDHGTGYLLAAGVLRALTEQSRDGGSRFLRLSLARTAAWLMDEVPPDTPDRTRGAGTAEYTGPGPWLAERDSPLGRLRYALPPVSFAGGPADWARPPGPWGADPAAWR
ncbi:CoA transferase [Streptomyces sp. NPDC006367]|uniref:CoA transferase n=1 Tax=unclassified Streptomyces TaxID=2593676 RepID=UPI0033A911E2